jgi:hypothetical protein
MADAEQVPNDLTLELGGNLLFDRDIGSDTVLVQEIAVRL